MGSSIYGLYARAVYKAREDMRRLNSKFTVFNGLGQPPAEGESASWAQWLIHVQPQDSVRHSAIERHRALGNESSAANAENARDSEIRQYNAAVDDLHQKLPQLRDLEGKGEVFRAADSVAHAFRYIVDEEVQKYHCMEQRNLSGAAVEFDADDCETHFIGPKRINLIANQTDAVRIQCNNVVVRDLEIVDGRSYSNIGHRDGVQLIPPNLKFGDRILADRMAGSVISDIIVDNCVIHAPKAKLQGIFASDGFCRNVLITNNKIKTAAGHFISIAGVLDGCRISNNILQQASDVLPQIKLFPGRLGGNMADDGIVYVLSFAANSGYAYSEVDNFANQYIGSDQQLLPDQFSDQRDRIPEGHGRVALGLKNFNYDRYMAIYSQWTVAEYKADDPVGFRRLRVWLEQRVEEYETGERTDFDRENYPILPDPTQEQRTRVLNKLKPALTLLNNGGEAFLNTRIADLQSMPIRSFIIKRLAVREGDVVLDSGLSADDLMRRTAQLKWFLDDELPIDQVAVSPVATAIVTTDAGARLQILPKNYSELKIMAAPVAVPQGRTITFSVNEADYSQSGDRTSYFWVVRGKTGNKPEFELDTTDWAEGEHQIRATLYVRSAALGVARQVPGSAVFEVTAPVVATSGEAGLEIPVRAFGSLKEHLRVNHTQLSSGQRLVVSLDQAFAAQQQGAKLRYFWTVSGQSVGQSESYEVDTTGFEPGECLVRVTVHRTDLVTNHYKQFTGVVAVAILEAREPA